MFGKTKQKDQISCIVKDTIINMKNAWKKYLVYNIVRNNY
jgi:hypothetical protein